MNRLAAKLFSFSETVAKIRSTGAGKEAAMYGPLRDLFIQVLGYVASDVDIDTTGEGGRPDVTVRAPSGLVDKAGNPLKIAWIVVEAKDEKVFADPETREVVFGLKSKYIGANTGWFVMVDPSVFIARQVGGKNQEADLVVPLDPQLTESQFSAVLLRLKADIAGVPEQLKRFRDGDQELIASQKLLRPNAATASQNDLLRYRIARKRFYATLRDATQHLQDACRHALNSLMPEIKQINAAAAEFAERFGGRDALTFDAASLTLTARPQGPEESHAHDKEARQLRRRLTRSPHVARLALEGLPAFQSRTGADDDKVHELFAIETANLILARVLLLRFFEDHGFFGEQRYICNGGVEAFQKMREYFAIGYVHLLEQAYKYASRLYSAAFDETELDWVFGSEDRGLSNAIEWTLFQFSRYDFTTIKGDILTGVYDRFMDRDKRKELGEFYTPPSVARYIIRRVGIEIGDRVLDPACGSGTFLIETYMELVGDDVDRGAAEFTDVARTLSNLYGNDLNTFSAVLCQIQLLWHILAFKAEIQQQGFPDLPISSKVNSLVVLDHFSKLDRFGEFDWPEYKAVIGNPPYVRKERSAQDLDARTVHEFEMDRRGFPGVSSKLNAYALFIFRALNSWCRPATEEQTAGRLGFIVPVSLFDSNETHDLRSLFAIGARWTILEIIDLELIYKQVFDADVLPAIIICENRPALESDKVSIRIATKECVSKAEDGGLPEFAFDSLPEEHIAYADLFSPDGRILTRLTKPRAAILAKLRTLSTFESVAKPFWVKKVRAAVTEYTDTPPIAEDALKWEARRMISTGIAFRATRPSVSGTSSHDIYKGENIIAAELQGEPILRNCDPSAADAPYLWQYGNILPKRAYAIAQVAHCPNAVAFDPTQAAFTNTATIFMPADCVTTVPFDLVLMSDVYVWFYALGARMGVLRTCRSHIYPTNLALLPWSESLIEAASAIEGMRSEIVSACRAAADASSALLDALNALKLPTLKQRIRADKALKISFGDNFEVTGYEAEIAGPHVAAANLDGSRLGLSDDPLDWVEINSGPLGHGLLQALSVREGASMSKAAILALSVPISVSELTIWASTAEANSPKAIQEEKRRVLHELNAVVADALGLSSDDLKLIETECQQDSFLKRIRPRYPGSVTRKQGFRTGLDASSRYES
jgi:hypothetical protein